MKQKLLTNGKTILKKAEYGLRKRSPEILLGLGVVAFVGTIVSAVKSTKEAEAVIEEHNRLLEPAHIGEIVEDENGGVYFEAEASELEQNTTKIYVNTGLKLAKVYAPTIILGATSLTCIFMSHNIMKNRNAAIATALANVTTSFNTYRENVKKRFGEQVDWEIQNGVMPVEVDVVDAETGEVTKKTEYLKYGDSVEDYTFLFDANSVYFERRGDHNFFYLKRMASVWTDKLRIERFVFLNDVLMSLGLERVSYGQTVGWKYDPNGDNVISFGLDMYDTPHQHRFVTNNEEEYILHFNVQGDVFHDAEFLGDVIQKENSRAIYALEELQEGEVAYVPF